MDTQRDMPARLCLYGDDRALLDCFEQVREAGIGHPEEAFGELSLDAAATDAAPVAAREARELGIGWYEDLGSMLACGSCGLLLRLIPDAAVDEPLPPGWRLVAPEDARLLFHLVFRAATRQTCRPDMARARRLLANVLDRVDEEIALLDPDGVLLDGNSRLAERLEQPREALAGLPGRQAFPDFPDFDAPGAAGEPSIRSTLAAGRKAIRDSSRVDRRGRLRYFRLTFYPVPGPDGQFDHLAAIRRDITQDVFLERRLQKSERLAAIGELSMFISHEIRNPLFAIAGFANALLRAKDLSESSREKASIILAESRRLDDILKDITNFARPMDAKPGESDLGEVVRRTTGLMRAALERQGITLSLSLDPAAPMVRGDPETLTQCLLNCLTNAMEAMPGGGRISLSTGVRQDRVFLAVADDGPGIAPDILPRVFNPFFSTRDKRAGLGLPMTKKILEDLGGSVELESLPGKGTTVTFFLPPFLELSPEEM